MQLYSFAYRYIKSPISGIKIPDMDKRLILAVNKEEAFVHSVVLNRPAVVICEWEEGRKKEWFEKIVKAINGRAN